MRRAEDRFIVGQPFIKKGVTSCDSVQRYSRTLTPGIRGKWSSTPYLPLKLCWQTSSVHQQPVYLLLNIHRYMLNVTFQSHNNRDRNTRTTKLCEYQLLSLITRPITHPARKTNSDGGTIYPTLLAGTSPPCIPDQVSNHNTAIPPHSKSSSIPRPCPGHAAMHSLQSGKSRKHEHTRWKKL